MALNTEQRQYYLDMVELDRGFFIVRDRRLVAVITFFIGDNDERYLLFKNPWTIIDDNPLGSTVYIDQLLTKEPTFKYIHSEFSRVLKEIKKRFPNVKQAKWLRAPALFRKKGVDDARTKTKLIVHCKNIK